MEQSAKKHTISSVAYILFSFLYPALVLSAFSENGIFPLHVASLIWGVLLAAAFPFVIRMKNWRAVYGILTALLFTISFLIGDWPVLLLAALAAYSIWIAVKVCTGESTQITSGNLMIFFIVFIWFFIFQLVYETVQASELLLFLITGFILYSAGTYLNHYFADRKDKKKRAGRELLKWGSLFSGVAVLLYFLAAPLRIGFYQVFDGIIWVFTLPLTLIGLEIDRAEISDMPDGESGESGSLEQGLVTGNNEFQEVLGVESIITFLVITGLIAVSGIIIYLLIVKAKKVILIPAAAEASYVKSNMVMKPEKEGNHKEPLNKIRKALFKLERKLSGKASGRQKSETVREWFERLEIPRLNDCAYIYERVRYGAMDVTNDEAEYFKTVLKEADKELSSRRDG
ncbi:hypothetical protein [Jeotgalibacillus aurantiacus]|uniref:hypothetical protein n=1 Tax=Jeotgalibacillus aurantiacus TaxID=2763266 RepID=UPI001D0A55A1|nr:hypothetical protein [Jeotgalibacillus aurantiacus]